MYRFGIEFFDKKGKKCFTKWVGDIRFPDFGAEITHDWEGNTLTQSYKLENSSNIYGNVMPVEDSTIGTDISEITVRPLGIKFTLNNVPTDADGVPYDYRIVRAERTDENKRMALQGPLMDIERAGEQGSIPQQDHFRPLTLNSFCRAVRRIYTPYRPNDTDNYYRYGNYASLLGLAQAGWYNGTQMQTQPIEQNVEHMFISPEIYYTDNFVVPTGMVFRPIGFQHIEERDTVDSYIVPNEFRLGGGGFDGSENYAMVTGYPIFFWGAPVLQNEDNGNDYNVLDAVVVACPPPDFNLGTAVYPVSTGTLNSFTYRNVVFQKQEGEITGDWKEAARAGKRLIVAFDKVFNTSQTLLNPGTTYQLMTSILMGRMERDLANQYGGNSYYDRTQTTYIPAGPIMDGSNGQVAVFEGDTYINVFEYHNINFGHREGGDQGLGLMETQWFIVESTINVDMRSAMSYNDTVDLSNPAGTASGNGHRDFRGNFDIQETGAGAYGVPNVNQGQYVQNYSLTDYNRSYISDNRAPLSIPQPLNYDPNIAFYSRIHRSLDKVYNDVYDRWLVFLPDNWKDVNTSYGPITNLIEYANKLYFYQERAIGIIGINEMALSQTDQAGATLLLGKADVMDQYVYVDNTHGVVIPNSVYTIPQGIVGFDSDNLKLFLLGGNGVNELSVTLGVQSTIRNKSEYGPLDFYGTYDSFNSRAYNMLYGVAYKTPAGNPTMLNGVVLPDNRQLTRTNLSFNTAINVFESFYDFTPNNMISYKGELISTNPDNNEGWLHSQDANRATFYGQPYDWWVTPIVNTSSGINHLITNFEINMDTLSSDPPKRITVSTFPNTGLYEQTIFKRRLNTWRCEAPRVFGGIERDRLRGHTFAVELKADLVTRTVIHNILSYSIPNIQ